MRRTKEEADVTREKLLDAALKVFSRKGYATTTLDDIAKEASVTRGAIYWHFKGGKAEIFNAITAERYGRVNAIVVRLLSEPGQPLEVLERLLVNLMELIVVDEDFRAVQSMIMFKTEVSAELTGGMREKSESQDWSIRFVSDLIRKGKLSGQVRADVDPEVAALAATGLLNGVIMMWLVNESVGSSKQFPLKAYARPIVRTFIDGLATYPPAGSKL